MSDVLSPLSDGLIPAAMRPGIGRGRRNMEPAHIFRNDFQRDRDRIVHASSFRRLEYKTQVFVNGEGDNYRTRLTHTIEVAQIARTMARTIGLNEDLAEAVALSHDLGHTPFGHAGERELDGLLAASGGFDHNLQGLRVVDVLERRYAAFPGLNLTYEVREAFVRHAGDARPLSPAPAEFPPEDAPLLEVAATMISDDIAYLAHDVDDGLYSGLLKEDELRKMKIWNAVTYGEMPEHGGLSASLRRIEGVRRLINYLVNDAVGATRGNIARFSLGDPESVRSSRSPVVVFSEKVENEKRELKSFLYEKFYRHREVMDAMDAARDKLRFIFGAYMRDTSLLPCEYREIARREGDARGVADYVAGMTDRFAESEYAALSGEFRL